MGQERGQRLLLRLLCKTAVHQVLQITPSTLCDCSPHILSTTAHLGLAKVHYSATRFVSCRIEYVSEGAGSILHMKEMLAHTHTHFSLSIGLQVHACNSREGQHTLADFSSW